MIEQHTALMRDTWNSPEPWAYGWPEYTGQTLEERGTILVIDHDRTVRDFLASILPAHGYDVVTATTAEEAEDVRQLIAPACIDLAMTDIHLRDDSPAWEGYVLYHCWTILQPKLPFVLMSDRSDSQALSALRRPAVRFLAKPFTAAVLLDTVTALIKA